MSSTEKRRSIKAFTSSGDSLGSNNSPTIVRKSITTWILDSVVLTLSDNVLWKAVKWAWTCVMIFMSDGRLALNNC